MRISVVIPTYNREESLRECLREVTSQDYPDYEVVVVDDGSQDWTRAMITRDFPEVIYLRQETNRGPAAARNRGIRFASGEIIAFTDDDCVPSTDWLSRLAAGFESHPSAGAIGGLQEPPEKAWRRNQIARYDRYQTRAIYRLGDGVKTGYPLPVGTNNLMMKKCQLLELGGFDELFPGAGGEDADLLYRLAQLGKPTVCLPICVAHHQSWTWPAFIKQQIQRGVGAAYFLARRGELRRPLYELVRLLALPFLFWIDLARSHSVSIAFLSIVGRFCQTLGRIKTYSKARAVSLTGISRTRKRNSKFLDPPNSEHSPGEFL